MSFTRLSDIPRSSELNYSSTCATCKYSKYGTVEGNRVCHRFPPSKTGEDVIVSPTHHCFEYKIHPYNNRMRKLVQQRDNVVLDTYLNLWVKHYNKKQGLKFWNRRFYRDVPPDCNRENLGILSGYHYNERFGDIIHEKIKDWDYEEALVKCSDSTIRKVEMFKQAILQNTVPSAEAFSD